MRRRRRRAGAASTDRGPTNNTGTKPTRQSTTRVEIEALDRRTPIELAEPQPSRLAVSYTSGIYAEFSPQRHSSDTRRQSHPGTLSAKTLESTLSNVPANGTVRVVEALVVVRR